MRKITTATKFYELFTPSKSIPSDLKSNIPEVQQTFFINLEPKQPSNTTEPRYTNGEDGLYVDKRGTFAFGGRGRGFENTRGAFTTGRGRGQPPSQDSGFNFRSQPQKQPEKPDIQDNEFEEVKEKTKSHQPKRLKPPTKKQPESEEPFIRKEVNVKPLTEAPVFPTMEEVTKSQTVLAAPLSKQDVEMEIPVEVKKSKKSKKKKIGVVSQQPDFEELMKTENKTGAKVKTQNLESIMNEQTRQEDRPVAVKKADPNSMNFNYAKEEDAFKKKNVKVSKPAMSNFPNLEEIMKQQTK